ncbi:hypothetical protein CYMTET_43944 [Cymbomonas tetramitiformis]|uniref:Mannosyl-glycoprotein endo-beta-N-acetylglucosaminidase n=1 Tax=Cymbomonas tetramitiformis TaxID=36881 RepID=A0AAE0C183_9CHLO|nr:hypothetical protein CYMTET_43944 [Cymbomonas tetramitiformis]|eukprot:gene11158-13183_t
MPRPYADSPDVPHDAVAEVSTASSDVLHNAVAEVSTASGDMLFSALQTLGVVLRNLQRAPAELKYRSLKLSNPKLQSQVLCCPGALALLEAVGFVSDGGILTLPPSTPEIESRVENALARLTTMEASRVRWRRHSAPGVAESALLLGRAADGTALHIGRAEMVGGGMQPGAARAHSGGFSTGYGGQERCVAEAYEVLCCTGGLAAAVRLVDAEGGKVPLEALPAGWEADGTPMFSAVVTTGAGETLSVRPGKVRPGLGGAAFGEDGKERLALRYKVVCLAPDAVLDLPPNTPRPPTRRFLLSVGELLAWTPDGIAGVSLDLTRAATLAPTTKVRAAELSQPRVLHCHDMAGGYNEKADGCYLRAFTSWAAVDEFVYFAHHRVSIPPPQWIEACHAHGVPCLATLITEHEEGAVENSRLLDNAELAAAQLAQMLVHYGHDGYLVNIEAPLPGGAADVARLARFLSFLRTACRNYSTSARVIVYDSIGPTGAVEWSDELTTANRTLFDACDGIFLNYWWRPPQLMRSRALAGVARCADVYVGVDVFARGDLSYGAGPGCAEGVQQVAETGLSLALFAPGWSLEVGSGQGVSAEEATKADAEFWAKLGTDRIREGM